MKVEKKYTPGPWQWDEPRNWAGLAARVFVAEPYGLVAQVSVEAWRPRAIGRANAQLISAAPEMAEALLDFSASMRKGDGPFGTKADLHALIEALHKADSALQKAGLL